MTSEYDSFNCEDNEPYAIRDVNIRAFFSYFSIEASNYGVHKRDVTVQRFYMQKDYEYIDCYDHDRETMRTFRVDRVEDFFDVDANKRVSNEELSSYFL